MRHMNNIFAWVTLVMVLVAIKPLAVEARQSIVVFDEGHAQRFLVERNGAFDLSGLSALFHKDDLQVITNTKEITEDVLAGVDALVISGAFAPFTPSEISTVINFVRKGGRLCVMLHIGSPVVVLLSKLNVYVSKGIVREQENLIQQEETNYYVTTSGRQELTEGIERFKVFGGWALITDNQQAEAIAQTSAKAWLDTNVNSVKDPEEKQRSLNLAIAGKLGEGSFAVFGDDAIFQNQFLSEENLQLGKNVVRWLKGDETVLPPNHDFL